MKYIASIVVLITISIICLSIYLDRKSYHVKYVIPDGYQGLLYLIHDEEYGDRPDRRERFFLYRFPKDGILVTSWIRPKTNPHYFEAEYYSGEQIEVFHGKQEDGHFGLFNVVGFTHERVSISLMGTYQETLEYRREIGDLPKKAELLERRF